MALGSGHQIGKYYPEMQQLRDDNGRQASRAVKRMLDPDGLINPADLRF